MLNLMPRDAIFAAWTRSAPDASPVPTSGRVTIPRAAAHSFAAVGDGVVWGVGPTEREARADGDASLDELLSEGATRPALTVVAIRETRYREVVAGSANGARVDATAIEPCYGPAVVVEADDDAGHVSLTPGGPLFACREHHAPLRVDGLPPDDGRAILVTARVAEAVRSLGLRRRGQVYSPGLVTAGVAQSVIWHGDLSGEGAAEEQRAADDAAARPVYRVEPGGDGYCVERAFCAPGEEGAEPTLWSAVSPILTREEADALCAELTGLPVEPVVGRAFFDRSAAFGVAIERWYRGVPGEARADALEQIGRCVGAALSRVDGRRRDTHIEPSFLASAAPRFEGIPRPHDSDEMRAHPSGRFA